MKKNHKSRTVCSIDEIPCETARGFTIKTKTSQINIIVLKISHKVYLYENRCPHVGTPLDWVPDQFLDESQSLIQCATHGALFRPDNGYCLAGPCKGQSLKTIPFQIRDNNIYI
jgi:nitrite reductase/ring-hydroxylating ferredoxin subunit